MTSKKKTTSKKKPTRSKKSKVTKSSGSLGGSKSQTRVKAEPKSKVSNDDGRKTNNKSRVNRIKDASREEIRKKFQALKYIEQLEKSAERLEEIIEKINKLSVIKAKLSKADKDRIYLLRLQSDALIMQRDTIKVQIDLNLRRLKYCVPELKAMELSDPDGNNPLKSIAEVFREALEKE